jgi:sialidase-1
MIVSLTGSPALASGTAASPSPVGAEQVLFRGGTAGYGCFRIPALVRTGTNPPPVLPCADLK